MGLIMKTAESLSPVRLLVIEDDQETADEIVSGFTEAGYEVRHAADGPQGLAPAGAGLDPRHAA